MRRPCAARRGCGPGPPDRSASSRASGTSTCSVASTMRANSCGPRAKSCVAAARSAASQSASVLHRQRAPRRSPPGSCCCSAGSLTSAKTACHVLGVELGEAAERLDAVFDPGCRQAACAGWRGSAGSRPGWRAHRRCTRACAARAAHKACSGRSPGSTNVEIPGGVAVRPLRLLAPEQLDIEHREQVLPLALVRGGQAVRGRTASDAGALGLEPGDLPLEGGGTQVRQLAVELVAACIDRADRLAANCASRKRATPARPRPHLRPGRRPRPGAS